MEVNLDIAQGKAYASRNHNDLRHVWQQDYNTERNQVDWLLQLRQTIPPREKSKYPPSVPKVHSPRQKPENTTPPEEGPYRTRWKSKTQLVEPEEQTYEKYQNFAETQHMVKGAATHRVSSGGAPEINWQLNLRNGTHRKPDSRWKRYFQKPHQSFELAPTNFENYKKQNISPAHLKYDRSMSALPMATIRDMPLKQDRWPGCEGTALNTWEHLVADRTHGHKSRKNIEWETTLREKKGYLNNLGSRIQDNRSEGCITEMLGKKKWQFGNAVPNDLALPYKDGGDPKLYHIRPVIGEPDPASLALRRHKQPRKEMPITDKENA